MARMGDVPQPSGADKTYHPYHTARSTVKGGNPGKGPSGADKSGH